MSRVDIMVDIETLGTKINSTIFQIAAAVFNIETGEIFETFDKVADISLDNIKVDGSTLKWWLNTDMHLLHKLLSKGEKPPYVLLLDFLEFLSKYKNDEVYLWGNGIIFDNAMIKYQAEEFGMSYPIKYKNDRDVRTLLELTSLVTNIPENEIKNMFDKNDLIKHNALDDVKRQVYLVSGCYNLLLDKEKVKV